MVPHFFARSTQRFPEATSTSARFSRTDLGGMIFDRASTLEVSDFPMAVIWSQVGSASKAPQSFHRYQIPGLDTTGFADKSL